MSAVFIFHGIGGSPDENWFPWLKKELEARGMTVIVPAFPNPSEPKLNEWKAEFFQYWDQWNRDTILIGHSLGAAFALRLLASANTPVHSTYLIAPVSVTPDNQFAPRMMSFTAAPFDWTVIRQNAGKITVMHSDNDPYISTESARSLANHLGANIDMIEGGGHFNTASGYTKFPALLSRIIS